MPPSEDKTQFSRDQAASSSYSGGFQPGQMLNNRYQILSKLGQGGMGLVYRVNQTLLNKEFALKTLEQNSLSPAALRRFHQEAKAAFALDHPNIIAVKEYGLLENDTPFLVMELINGETLADRIKRVGPLPWEKACPIFVQICFGLAYAHQCGIVHRDIKPGNIMLLRTVPEGTDGSVKILDFGIAKLAAHEGGEIQALTRTGEVFGSPMYMSPEQCSGFHVDHRSDIYSLGCVFYEVLTGAPPCVGDNALTTMMKHQSETPLTLKQASMGAVFPSGLEAVVAKMLAKAPDQRYQSLSTVANDLGAIKRGAAVSVPNSSPSTATKNLISMSASKFYLLMLAVILLTVSITELVHLAIPKPTVVAAGVQEPVKQDASAKQDADPANILTLAEDKIRRKSTPLVPGSINSSVTVVDSKEVRHFKIPGERLGYISNLNSFGAGPGRYKNPADYIKIASDADNVSFPADEHLTLEIGGNSWDATKAPEVYKQIGKQEFYGLTITPPKRAEEYLEISPADYQNIDSILRTAQGWSNLECVCLKKFPLTKENAEAISRMPNLKTFMLEDALSPEISDLLAKQYFLRQLVSLQLISTTDVPVSIDNVLKQMCGAKKLKSLALKNIQLTASSAKLLSRCEHLKVLWLSGGKLDNNTLAILAKIDTLKYILGPRSIITDQQLNWLSSKRPDIRFTPG